MNRKPISVCIATFNGQKYIHDQLNSILKQLRNYDEVIIVDDCSEDETIAVISKIADKRIKLIINDKNIGVLKNFEKAILLSKNSYVFLSDQDDIWLDGKVDHIMNLFVNCNVDLINHDAKIIGLNNEVLPDSMFKLNKSGSGIIKNFIRDTYMGSSMAFKREVALDSFPMPYNIGPIHDTWIGICSEILGYKVLFDAEILLFYRRHDNNVSKRRSLFSIIVNRVKLSTMLLFFYFRHGVVISRKKHNK